MKSRADEIIKVDWRPEQLAGRSELGPLRDSLHCGQTDFHGEEPNREDTQRSRRAGLGTQALAFWIDGLKLLDSRRVEEAGIRGEKGHLFFEFSREGDRRGQVNGIVAAKRMSPDQVAR